MDINIGAFNEVTRMVPVTFTKDAVVYHRDVRACLDALGKYDKAATAKRVDEVSLGVGLKISLGVITMPAPADPVPAPPQGGDGATVVEPDPEPAPAAQ